MDPFFYAKTGNFSSAKYGILSPAMTYVFAGTNYPQSIQVWDSKTGELVHTYNLKKNYEGTERFIDIMDMKVLEKSIWIIGAGLHQCLMKIDVESGNVSITNYKDLGFSLEGIFPVSQEVDSKGTLWVNSFGEPAEGMKFACFDSSGNLLEKFQIKHEDIAGSYIYNTIYKNGKYYMLAQKFGDFENSDKEQDGFTLLNLSDKTYEKIPYLSIFPKGFLKTQMPGINFSTFLAGITNFTLEGENYFGVVVVPGYAGEGVETAPRFLFHLESLDPFEAEYLNIKWDMRRLNTLTKTSDKFYAAGRRIDTDFSWSRSRCIR